jgi:hypothetical protein
MLLALRIVIGNLVQLVGGHTIIIFCMRGYLGMRELALTSDDHVLFQI